MHAEVGADLERALRSRRDLLTEVSREYYRLLAHDVVDRSSDPSATAIYAPVPPPQAPAQALQPWAKPDPLASERRKYETTRDWGRDSLFFPQFGHDSNRGLVLGMILQRTTYGFDLEPYASQMKFGAAWSTGTNQPRLAYGADFRTLSPLRGLF